MAITGICASKVPEKTRPTTHLPLGMVRLGLKQKDLRNIIWTKDMWAGLKVTDKTELSGSRVSP
jgi:hypothetical protein